MLRGDTRHVHSRTTIPVRDKPYVQILLQVFNVLRDRYGERYSGHSYNDVSAGKRQESSVSKPQKKKKISLQSILAGMLFRKKRMEPVRISLRIDFHAI